MTTQVLSLLELASKGTWRTKSNSIPTSDGKGLMLCQISCGSIAWSITDTTTLEPRKYVTQLDPIEPFNLQDRIHHILLSVLVVGLVHTFHASFQPLHELISCSLKDTLS